MVKDFQHSQLHFHIFNAFSCRICARFASNIDSLHIVHTRTYTFHVSKTSATLNAGQPQSAYYLHRIHTFQYSNANLTSETFTSRLYNRVRHQNSPSPTKKWKIQWFRFVTVNGHTIPIHFYTSQIQFIRHFVWFVRCLNDRGGGGIWQRSLLKKIPTLPCAFEIYMQRFYTFAQYETALRCIYYEMPNGFTVFWVCGYAKAIFNLFTHIWIGIFGSAFCILHPAAHALHIVALLYEWQPNVFAKYTIDTSPYTAHMSFINVI